MIGLTGCTGFLGCTLLNALKDQSIKCFGRNVPLGLTENYFYQGFINNKTDYFAFMQDTDVLIHCAARVHVMDDSSKNPLEEFREVNTYGTLNLAQQAADAGVKRFIFISTIKVRT